MSTSSRSRKSPLWRILFFSLVVFQLLLVVSLFFVQPQSNSTSHHSPHHLLNQRGTDVENSRETFHQKPSERDEKRLFLSGDADPKVPTDDTSEEDLSGGDNEPADISEHEPTPIIQQTSQDDLHEHDFHLDGKIDTKETWQHMKNLPIWLKEYLTWHQEQRALITPDNWKNFTYIILQCVREDPHCGGTSDRLKPIPFLLYVAYKFRRIFLIWWTRPCALEEFLVPNAINWTVPEFIPLSDPEQNGRIIAKLENVLNWAGKPERIIRPRIQTYDGGQLLYENRTGSSYNDVYHDLFRLLFEPAPPIAKILRTEMKQAGLVPGEYAVAHYRAFYARASRRPEMIAKHAINAANCASQLRPGGPIYFASDSLHALAKVREYAKEHSYKIVTIENQEPLHLDKAGNWSVRHPSDFYSIFVDLFLMGMGRCLTFGQGGFGRFGLLLSYNATCTSRHIYKTHQMDCEWAEAIQPKAPES